MKQQKRDTLMDIALRWKTDKTENGYIERYESYFEPLRDEKLNILEIGVKRAHPKYPHGAASHRTWKEYFPKAQIYGIDIDPKNKEYEQERLEIFIGSQDDPEIMKAVVEKAGHFDIIIDDGSHVNGLTLASFEGLFPHLKSGGLYVFEDLGASYLDLEACQVRQKALHAASVADDPDAFVHGWFGMDRLPGSVSYTNRRSDMLAFFHHHMFRMDLGNNKRWADRFNLDPPDIERMDFTCGQCFMKKA